MKVVVLHDEGAFYGDRPRPEDFGLLYDAKMYSAVYRLRTRLRASDTRALEGNGHVRPIVILTFTASADIIVAPLSRSSHLSMFSIRR